MPDPAAASVCARAGAGIACDWARRGGGGRCDWSGLAALAAGSLAPSKAAERVATLPRGVGAGGLAVALECVLPPNMAARSATLLRLGGVAFEGGGAADGVVVGSATISTKLGGKYPLVPSGRSPFHHSPCRDITVIFVPALKVSSEAVSPAFDDCVGRGRSSFENRTLEIVLCYGGGGRHGRAAFNPRRFLSRPPKIMMQTLLDRTL